MRKDNEYRTEELTVEIERFDHQGHGYAAYYHKPKREGNQVKKHRTNQVKKHQTNRAKKPHNVHNQLKLKKHLLFQVQEQLLQELLSVSLPYLPVI